MGIDARKVNKRKIFISDYIENFNFDEKLFLLKSGSITNLFLEADDDNSDSEEK